MTSKVIEGHISITLFLERFCDFCFVYFATFWLYSNIILGTTVVLLSWILFLCTTRGLFLGILDNLLTTLIPTPRAIAGGFRIHLPKIFSSVYYVFILEDWKMIIRKCNLLTNYKKYDFPILYLSMTYFC